MLVDLGGLFDRLYFPNILSHSDRPHADTPSPYMQKQKLYRLGILSRYEKDVYLRVNTSHKKHFLHGADHVFTNIREQIFLAHSLATVVQPFYA